MVRMKQRLSAVIVLAVVLSVGVFVYNHSSGNPSLRRITAEQRAALALATPAQVVEMYYRALGEKDWNLAMATLSDNLLKEYGAEEVLAVMKAITRVSDVKIEFEKSITPDRMRLMADFYQELEETNMDLAMGTGKTTRFVDVVRVPGGEWRIDSFATSP